MFALLQMKYGAPLAAGLSIIMSSSPMQAALSAANRQGKAAVSGAWYCQPKYVPIGAGGCWNDQTLQARAIWQNAIAPEVRSMRHESRDQWILTPYEMTFSPLADRYQLVGLKVEVNLSPVSMSLRLPKLFH